MLIKHGEAEILQIIPEEEIDQKKVKEAIKNNKKNISTVNNSELDTEPTISN